MKNRDENKAHAVMNGRDNDSEANTNIRYEDDVLSTFTRKHSPGGATTHIHTANA